MGQKTHPYGFRLVYNKPWHSRWYADQDYSKLLIMGLILVGTLLALAAGINITTWF